MARARALTRARAHDTRALLLKRVGYGESDLVVTLLTEELGRVSALARGARKSRRRFAGSLEPMHTLHVQIDERFGAELLVLKEATIERARRHLTGDLDRLDAAGRALGWVRRAAPPRTPEAGAWRVLESLLDRLDVAAPAEPRRELAAHGLLLLTALGWGIDLVRCVACGKPCAPGRAAMVDPARGGLVCRACGGARLELPGAARERLWRTSQGDPAALAGGDVAVALEIVDAALSAHMGLS